MRKTLRSAMSRPFNVPCFSRFTRTHRSTAGLFSDPEFYLLRIASLGAFLAFRLKCFSFFAFKRDNPTKSCGTAFPCDPCVLTAFPCALTAFPCLSLPFLVCGTAFRFLSLPFIVCGTAFRCLSVPFTAFPCAPTAFRYLSLPFGVCSTAFRCVFHRRKLRYCNENRADVPDLPGVNQVRDTAGWNANKEILCMCPCMY